MKFDELQKILEDNFSTDKLSDIAHELGVTPQVVSNWKSRNQVPYKYVKIVRKKILKLSSDINFPQDKQIQSGLDHNYLESSSNDSFEVILNYFDLVKKGYRIVLWGGLASLFIALVHVNFIKKPNHVARARVLPASSSSGGNLGGIATQLGI